MDYTKVPRVLIYKERSSLEDFGVYETKSFNATLYEALISLDDLKPRYQGVFQEILRLFNDAYYYLTQIFLEKNPLERYATYCDDAGAIFPGNYDWDSESREMVVKCMLLTMLRTFGNNLPAPQQRLLTAMVADINESGSYKDIGTALSHLRGEEEDIAFKISCQFQFNPMSSSIPERDYTRRDIQELLNSGVPLRECLFAGKILREAVNTLCKDKKQKIALIDRLLEPEKDGYGALDEKITESYRCLYELRSELTGDPLPDKLPFERAADALVLGIPMFPTLKPIDYNQEEGEENNFDKAVSDKSDKEIIAELREKLKEQSKKNEELKAELKEAYTIPSNVTALQRVRMELARQLLLKAGANLDKWGNKDKAGTIMSTMLDIKPASTCKTYISDHNLNKDYHKETIDEINPLLESLELDFQL